MQGREWEIEDKDYRQVLKESRERYDKLDSSESSDEAIDSKAIPEGSIYAVLCATKDAAEERYKRENIMDSTSLCLITLGQLSS